MKSIFWPIVLVLLTYYSTFSQVNANNWEDIKKSGRGTVTIYWFPNDPYSYVDATGQLIGIEVEIMEGFQKYVKKHNNINLSIRWTRVERFVDVLTLMKNKTLSGAFGTAGFSFSEERRTFMKFSPSYMADIAVLVSTPDIPIVRSQDDLKKYLQGATALTAQGTLLEKELVQLGEENKIDFKIEYTGGSVELIKLLNSRTNSFGYLNLPVYLLNLDKGLTKLNRQNYLTKRYEGRGIGLPITSDWDFPINEYFASSEFKKNIEFIISRYINIDLYHFIETFTPENEVSLLNKEKDIQQLEIKFQQLEIKEKNQRQLFLVVIIMIATLLFLIIALLFRKQLRTNRQLLEQKDEIEAQSEEIASINNSLELTIRQRTQELENKNKALADYAFITAHKLRSPLSTILGLVNLMEEMTLKEEDKIIIQHMNQSAKNLDSIVHTIMDTVENTDPKQGSGTK